MKLTVDTIHKSYKHLVCLFRFRFPSSTVFDQYYRDKCTWERERGEEEEEEEVGKGEEEEKEVGEGER